MVDFLHYVKEYDTLYIHTENWVRYKLALGKYDPEILYKLDTIIIKNLTKENLYDILNLLEKQDQAEEVYVGKICYV